MVTVTVMGLTVRSMSILAAGIPTVHGWGRLRLLLLLGHLEFDDDLSFKFLVPWHDHIHHLAESRQRLGSNEEEISQIDSRGRASLVDTERSVLAPDVQVSQTKSENDGASVFGQVCHILRKLLVPAELSVEFDLG